MRSRDAAASGLAILILLLLSSGCEPREGSTRPPGGTVPGSTQPPSGTGEPGGTSVEPGGTVPGSTQPPSRTGADVPGPSQYELYVERCRRATRDLPQADVIYDPDIQMTLGVSKTVTAVVTFDTELPPEKILPGQGATSEKILVACEIQGQLRGDSREFSIQPSEWESRSVVGAQNAKWTWIVVPQVGGTHTLVVDLKPIVRVEDPAVAAGVTSEDLTTNSFESTVHVGVPADQRISDMANRARVVFDNLSALMKALLGFLTAMAAVFTTRWFKGRRDSRRQPVA
jgi:hypothetical protein